MKDESIKSSKFVFDDEKVTELVQCANISFKNHERNYLQFYYQLWQIKKLCEQKNSNLDAQILIYLVQSTTGEIIERNKTISFNDLVKRLFNIDKSQLSRGFNILFRFSNFNPNSDAEIQSIKIKPQFSEFSDSKLQELLPYQDDYIKDKLQSGELKGSCSVKEMRKILKNAPEKQPKPEPLPFDLNRKKPYMLDELRQYNYNDLVMIAWELYQKFLTSKKTS